MGSLYVVATPIGHLGDITYRAVASLRAVAVVACEDTRQTKKLLTHYQISTPTVSIHQHSSAATIQRLIDRVTGGDSVAVVTDAGTPGISDPGSQLVAAAVAAGVSVVPIPGPSALTALASVAGIRTDEFLFLGFLPHKKGRQTLLREIVASHRPVILYESTHRIEKLLGELSVAGAGERQLVVGRELTKTFETLYRGTPARVLDQLQATSTKGEFVLIIAPQTKIN